MAAEPMSPLEAEIRRHLPAALFESRADDSKSYHESFRTSGEAKARKAFITLLELGVDPATCVYVSVGGSYGSEVVWMLENTALRHGILLEYDPAVVREVAGQIERLEKLERELIFIPGDATQQADACRRAIESVRAKSNIDTVVCSANAVFHELPTRSPGFHLGSFLHKMLHHWPRAIFICREPCAPTNWPEIVELSVQDLPAEVLEQLAKEIQRRLPFAGKVRRVGDYVEMSRLLAVEAVMKLFYAKDMQHELEERLTTIEPTEFSAELENLLGPSSVSMQYLASQSFEANYRRFRIRARDPQKRQPLPIPLVFCAFTGDSARSTTADIPVGSAPSGPALNIAGSPRIEIVRPPGPKPEKPRAAKRKSGRYLRRRCRVITDGTSPLFRSLMQSLLSRQYDLEEAVQQFYESWERLNSPYEQMMTHAACLEIVGDIEQMLTVLSKLQFTGTEESARLLYQAIGYEKLGELDVAERQLRKVLDTEKQPDLLRAAQFNMHVCYEKADKLDLVQFDSFLKDGIVFLDGERLSDKAVAMELIMCIQQGRSFTYRHQLSDSLEYLRGKSTAGYAKTLLTKIDYDKQPLTESMINSIIDDLKKMDANSRMAILMRMSDYLPVDSPLRASIMERARAIPGDSHTLRKWKERGAEFDGAS